MCHYQILHKTWWDNAGRTVFEFYCFGILLLLFSQCSEKTSLSVAHVQLQAAAVWGVGVTVVNVPCSVSVLATEKAPLSQHP